MDFNVKRLVRDAGTAISRVVQVCSADGSLLKTCGRHPRSIQICRLSGKLSCNAFKFLFILARHSLPRNGWELRRRQNWTLILKIWPNDPTRRRRGPRNYSETRKRCSLQIQVSNLRYAVFEQTGGVSLNLDKKQSRP